MSTLPPSVGLCAVTGATATVVQIFDRLKNGNESWLHKAGLNISGVFTDSAANVGWGMSLVLLLLLFSGALVAWVYQPSQRREAFILGAGLLGILAPATQPNTPAPQQKVSTAVQADHGLLHLLNDLIPSAMAQTVITPPNLEQPAKVEPQGIQINVSGPLQYRIPETTVQIYSDGKPVQAFSSATKITTALPPGKYEIELAHRGYRSQIFPVEVNSGTQTFAVTLDRATWDSFDNFFGPKLTKPNPINGR